MKYNPPFSHLYSFILAFVVLLIMIACEEDSITGSDDPLYPDLNYTATDSAEAFQMAWYWDRKMTPTDSTRDYLLYHMKLLRQTWADSLPFVAQCFLRPWMPGMAVIGFDSTAAAAVRNGTYSGFATLPEAYQPDYVEISNIMDVATIYFDTAFHPVVMCQYFNVLPGVNYAKPNNIDFSGGDLPLYFGWVDSLFAVIFNENPLYLPTTHYFKESDGEPLYLDSEAQSDSLIRAEMSAIRDAFWQRMVP